MTDFLRLGGGLLLLIAANVALGSVSAVLRREWDRKVFLRGIVKGVVAAAAFAAVWCAGLLNPDLVVIEAGGRSLGLGEAVRLLLTAGFACYAVKVLKHLKTILGTKSKGEEEPKEVEGEEESPRR